MRTFVVTGTERIIAADEAIKLVVQLNDLSLFGRCDDLREFMERTSEACYIQHGASISTKSPEEFVEGLINTGFLQEIHPQ